VRIPARFANRRPFAAHADPTPSEVIREDLRRAVLPGIGHRVSSGQRGRAAVFFDFVGMGVAVALSSCGGQSVERGSAPTAAQVQPPSFVGRIWLSADPAAAAGSLRIFLPDGTMLMDSCGETYRLARWELVSATRIAWSEDGTRIEADLTEATPDQLRLRLHLVNEQKEERYRPAPVPYVCPDMRPPPPAPQ
jgi:hypothetical protein